ncbi:hypothetical protein AU252_19755 [Pseudarthrobacter sulfonivorans]|uniref:Uncharacterized protein n=1 Tax=Pseudarthrobacter sulfonivorans TaxID=121292 RepID=A0A0U3QF75_9MICC|nr:hypothetical protein [Pseudarthrobacter sulfonivorans]ALV43117.1 hypothetical protein AU252_19755 [Pseudarthrobacter sulfonivorans]
MARSGEQRGGGPDLPEITITSPNILEALARAKEIGPAVQRNLRRSLRGVGDDIIKDQKAILSGAKPGVARKAGMRVKKVKRGGTGKVYLRAVNVYKAEAASRSRSTGMRNRVKASLKTRVVAGATRSGISIRADKSVGGVMVKGWNKQVIRHPVFHDPDKIQQTFVSQFGQPYWWEPIKRGRIDAKDKALRAIDDALNGKG